jgi:hypothetical protein
VISVRWSRALRLACIFSLSATGLATAEPHLSPQAKALIAPVHAAFVKVKADQAKLPQPKGDRERLERMEDLDQVGREADSKIDFTVLPKGEQQAARAASFREIIAQDRADQAALKEIIARDGWITRSKYGEKASLVAFLIVQHAANDPALMRSTLTLLKPLAASGEVDGGEYALLYDRLTSEFDHTLQRYGTQLHCVGGVWTPFPMDDPARVDERRKAIGIKQTEADYIKLVARESSCN